MTNEVTITTLSDSQKEIRSAFLGGFAGQLISGLLWLIASAISVFAAPRYGMLFLFFGCMFIFPLTQVALRITGRPAKVKKENGLWSLGTQAALTVPIKFFLVGAAILYKEMWFFPAESFPVVTTR